MQLFFRKTGAGPPLVILHGLYGSSDNWLSISNMLQSDFEVFIPDLRNHGRSPHSDIFNYKVLSEDILEFFEHLNIKKAILMGHSMGGKIAMHVARLFPEILTGLLIVDIAPRNYYFESHAGISEHAEILDAMQNLYLPEISTRGEADKLLSVNINNKKLRGFLLKNLKRAGRKNFEWQLNLPVIKYNFTEISEGFGVSCWNNTEVTGFPVLFVKGENSGYILPEDEKEIMRIFPSSEITEIQGTGHWLHAEEPEKLAEIIRKFAFG